MSFLTRNSSSINLRRILTVSACHQSRHSRIIWSGQVGFKTIAKRLKDEIDHQSSPNYQNNIASNLKDIGQSAKQETRKSFQTVLDAVSGNKLAGDHDQKVHSIDSTIEAKPATGPRAHQSSEIISDLHSVGGLLQAVPRGAIIFGAAGVVPYFATSITTVYLARQAFLAHQGTPAKFDTDAALTLLYHNENLQIAYGAVILSFLGAIHWGIDFSVRGMQVLQPGQPQGSQRYWLGTLPVVLAWPTLLLPNQLALASQWAAFTIVWYTDMMATSWGWTPPWYSTYRFGLTALVGSSLVVTLAASSYWSLDDIEHTSLSNKLQAIRNDQVSKHKNSDDGSTGGGRIEGVMSKDAPIGSVRGDEAFVRITDVAGEKRKHMNEAKA